MTQLITNYEWERKLRMTNDKENYELGMTNYELRMTKRITNDKENYEFVVRCLFGMFVEKYNRRELRMTNGKRITNYE